MSTGYAILMDFFGKKADLEPIPKFARMRKVSARSSCINSQRIMSGSSFSIIWFSFANIGKSYKMAKREVLTLVFETMAICRKIWRFIPHTKHSPLGSKYCVFGWPREHCKEESQW